MTVTGPRVRDFTTGGTTLRVEIDVSPAYELVLSLFTFCCEDRSDYEVGEDFFERTYAKASPSLQAGLDLVASAGELMVGLLGIVHRLPEPKTVAGLVDYLEATSLANEVARKRLGECMLLSWYDRDRDFESPQHASECHAASATPGYVDYGLHHGATLEVDIEDGRFVFFYLPLPL